MEKRVHHFLRELGPADAPGFHLYANGAVGSRGPRHTFCRTIIDHAYAIFVLGAMKITVDIEMAKRFLISWTTVERRLGYAG